MSYNKKSFRINNVKYSKTNKYKVKQVVNVQNEMSWNKNSFRMNNVK